MRTTPTPNNRPPPKHLAAAGRRLWRAVGGEYEIAPHQVEVLRQAAEAADRCEEARLAIAEHGTTFVDRWGQPRARPEVAIEANSRLAVARLLRELALDPGESDARPPRAGGRT